jgi:hypothetical protein
MGKETFIRKPSVSAETAAHIIPVKPRKSVSEIERNRNRAKGIIWEETAKM